MRSSHFTPTKSKRWWLIYTLTFFLLPMRLLAAEPATVSETTDLTQLTLSELMEIKVNVNRTPEKLAAISAAVSVVTQEDIRRSGVTSIPEALRLVPGLQVARVDSHTWAISSRGFNDIFANKLLVMMDGRTIYTPLFSGVFWDVQDTLLEDIDRIEVVRGPGATLWGANAVNGVINIITKSAKDTQGLLLSGGGGTEELGFANVRYGVKVADQAWLKVYAKYFDRDSMALPSGAQNNDSWQMTRGGFRLDWEPRTNVTQFTFQGDIYSGALDQTYSMPTTTFPFATNLDTRDNVAGGNLLGRWTRHFSEDSDLQVQTYYDRTVRNTVVFGEHRDTGDVDAQHRFKIGGRNEIVWGAGFRTTHDDVRNSLNVTLMPASRTLNLYSAFAQDEITVVEEKLHFTLGSKFEHNDFTGFEIQPSARAVWTPIQRHSIWASVSRAVRTPSRAESDIRLNQAPPVPLPPGSITIFGNPNLRSEELIAYEIGYRVEPMDRLTFDLTAFYNDYNHLRSIEPLTAGPVGPSQASNKLFGEGYGFEAAATAQPLDKWRLQGGYSFLRLQLHRSAGGLDSRSEIAAEGSSPRNQFFLRSSHDLPCNLQFDATLRYVDNLPAQNIPSYLTLDLRLAWSPRKNLELAIVGQNLLDNQHPEFAPTFIGTQRAEVERSVYGKVTLRF